MQLAPDRVHPDNELTISEKDKSAMWERQRKIKQDNIDAIVNQIDELTTREIVPQQHRVQDAKDAIYLLEHPIG